MKTTLNFLCAGLLALLTSSCLEHSATIRLNKDGSGTITEETVFSAEASAMMAQMPPGGDGPKFDDPKKAAAAATKMGEGVTVDKVEKIDKGGRIGGRVVYKFKDINKVKFTYGESMSDAGKDMGPPGAPGDAPDAAGAEPEKKPMTFKYEGGVLTMVNPDAKAAAEAKKPAADGDAPDAAEEPDPQALAMMQGMFKDMKMSLKVEIVDGIAETNATNVEGNTVTLMDMAFGKLLANPEHMKKLTALQGSSPAEAAAAFKGVEGFKIETKDTVTVKVK
jgi:hypothetical protein